MTNAYIAQQREQFKGELLNQPTRDEICAMLTSEDEVNPVPVLESLLNRTLYLKSHGINRTLHQMLHGGFYGPINRGKLPFFINEVENDARLRTKMYAAIDFVLAGSDVLRGHTDQGLPSDPGGAYEEAHSHVMIGGEVFGDWGGGPGGYGSAALWRMQFEANANNIQLDDGTQLSPAGYPVSNSSMQQNDVEQLQSALVKLGYRDQQGDQIAVDGIYGPATTFAVGQFQVKNGITPVDGFSGPVTWTAIQKALSNG